MIFLFLLLSLKVHALSPELKIKYPLSVLTENDYDIIKEKDLRYFAKLDDPGTASKRDGGHVYWQCTETRNVKWSCGEGKDHFHAPELTFTLSGVKQFYVSRHNYEDPFCLDIQKKFFQITSGEKYLCVGGSGGAWNSKRNLKEWTYEIVKTKRGCTSWFEGGCQ